MRAVALAFAVAACGNSGAPAPAHPELTPALEPVAWLLAAAVHRRDRDVHAERRDRAGLARTAQPPAK